MSDDLISRETIKSQIETIRDCWAISPYVSSDDMKLYAKVFNVVLRTISDCRIAFDKGKVIEEIKNQLELSDTCAYESDYPTEISYYKGRTLGHEIDIDIVEKGGI